MLEEPRVEDALIAPGPPGARRRPMIDPTGTLITELRTANIASAASAAASRPARRRPTRATRSGPGTTSGSSSSCRLGHQRRRAGIAQVRIGVRAYGATAQDAAALFGEISDAVDIVGPAARRPPAWPSTSRLTFRAVMRSRTRTPGNPTKTA
jgi:hypothetical protein